ncbi:MAG: hypothetical protein ABIK61_06890 [candidate division WOR-3 bacterium]
MFFSILFIIINAQFASSQSSLLVKNHLQQNDYLTLASPHQSHLTQPSLSFAESLYQEKDYFNAITEFERYLFFHPNTSNSQEIKYKLALSYFYCNETLKTEKILQELSSEIGVIPKLAQRFLAQLYIDSKKYLKAKIELNDLLISDNIQDKTEIYRELGYIALQEKDTKTALGYFTLAQDSWLITETERVIKLPKKNVSLSQLLSTFIPGSGEIYCGQLGWGILSFLANSTTIYGTIHSFKNKHYLDATLIFSIFFMRFYNGSRSNARDFALEYNEKIYQAKIKEIEKFYRLQK